MKISCFTVHKHLLTLPVTILLITALNAVSQPLAQQTGRLAYHIIYQEKPEQTESEQIIPVYYASEKEILPKTIQIKFRTSAGINSESRAALPASVEKTLSPAGIVSAQPLFTVQSFPSVAENDKYGLKRIFEIRYTNNLDCYELCRELMSDQMIEYATPVYIRHTTSFTPNDPSYTSQYALTKIKAADAWDISKGDTNITIAIIDGGTDWTHVDLSDNIRINRGEIPGNGIDDDGNGKVDDIHGWDLVGNISSTQIQAGSWQEDNDPRNGADGHGTHTAGCASAVTNNGIGVASIGFNCRILPIKCGSEQVSGIYRGYTAIIFAAQCGAKIINCSWGGAGYSPVEQDVISQVTDMGCLVVAASGNNGENVDYVPHFPSSYKRVLSVGSTSTNDLFLSSSNYGSMVAVFAPGQNVLSTYLSNGYQSQTGTSMASPIAAGLAGLVFSIHKDWTPDQVRRQIRATCDDLTGGNPNLRRNYFGRINALNALQYNHPDYPMKTMPGIEYVSLSFGNGTALTDYNPAQVNIKLTNLLSKADSLEVGISAVSNFVDIDITKMMFYDFNPFDTNKLTIHVQLKENNPWYQGNAKVLLTYKYGDYLDYETIDIPINITSGNSLATLGSINPLIQPQWHGMSAPARDIAWGVGGSSLYGALYFRYNGTFTANRIYDPNYGYLTVPAYCVYAFNSDKAMAGTGNGYILTTTNGGVQWNRKVVTSISDFINTITFFSDHEGIFLGDQKNGKWGVARTTDGGNTWTQVEGLPAPLSGENGFVESFFRRGDQLWFGTSAGRLFYSADKGLTWTATTVHTGGTVERIAFSDSVNGLVTYTESSGTTAPRYLASTTDGGKTWTKRIVNFTEKGQVVLKLYGLPQSKSILCRYSGGETYMSSDLAQNWEPLLSKEMGNYDVGTVFCDAGKGQFWSIGYSLTKLEFDYKTDSSLAIRDLNLYPKAQSIRVYPNPVDDFLNILLKDDMTKAQITLYDLSGHIIQSEFFTVQGNTYSLNMQNFKPGIYLMKVLSENATEVFGIVRE